MFQEQYTNLLTAELICKKKRSMFTLLVNNYLAPTIVNPFIKVVLSITYAVLIVYCIFNGLKIEYDVRLSTFLPKYTQEYRYLEAQSRYFGFYNFYLVTTELEYPLNQQLLHEYHASLAKVPHVLKDSNGGLNMNDFWLANFRDYLVDLQKEFDNNLKNGCITSDKWYNNATEKAVLAFKLLAQTGIIEYPVDRIQIMKKKLVKEGIIDPNAFYNYLSVWNCNDQMSYSSSQANLMPKPFQYFSSKAEYDLKIPKSQPLVYSQMPFYLKNLKTTGKIVETLTQIRKISDEYNVRGLKNYPVGLIFAYFNHFLVLDRLLIAQLCITLLSFVLINCVFVHWTKIWCVLFSVLTLLTIMFLTNINALSGTMGAVHFVLISREVVLILTGYLSAIGNRERRLRMSLELNADSIIKGELGLLLCAVVLATSHFEFIQRHVFTSLLISLGTSAANSFFFYPILLSLAGPKGELQPIEHRDRISTPPPPPPPPTPTPPRASQYTKHPRKSTVKATREPSLTTITEESCNQSIVVEPQVTVEYSSPESSSSGQYTTKVTATANIKVEVVAPVPVHRTKCTKCHRLSEDKSCV